MTPDASLAEAHERRREEEAKTEQARPVRARIDNARRENHLAELFRQAFNAGR